MSDRLIARGFDYLYNINNGHPDVASMFITYSDTGVLELNTIYKDGRKTKYIVEPSTSKFSRPIEVHEDDPIYKLLLEKYVFLDQPHKAINLFGKVQSGKSQAIMAICWCAIYRWKLRPFLFCLNRSQSYTQLMMRDYQEFNQWLRSNGETDRILYVNGIQGSNGEVNSDPHCITLAMNNKYQLRKISEQNMPYLIVGDEADTLVTHCDPDQDISVTGPLFHSFRSAAASTWMVTATPFAVLNQKGIFSRTVELPAKPTYREFKDFEYHELPKEEVASLRRNNDCLVPVVRRAIEACSVRGTRPYSCVSINTHHKKCDHHDIAHALQRSGIPSFVINGEGIFHYKQDGTNEKTNHHRVSDLFDYFEDEYKKDGVYRDHVLVGKNMFCRSVTFRPSPGKGDGGLNGMILLPSNNGSSRVQELRMSGNYSYDYPKNHIFMGEDDYRKTWDELYYNIPTLVKANKTDEIECRLQIEEKPMIFTGKHDRPNTDDTHLDDLHGVMRHDFPTQAELVDFLKKTVKHDDIQSMTEETLTTIPAPEGFRLGMNGASAEARNIVDRIKEIAGILPDKHLIMAWNIKTDYKRWEDMHDMRTRFKHTPDIKFQTEYIAGPSEDGSRINIVKWRPGYFRVNRDDPGLDHERDMRKETAYIFQTIDHTWRYFIPGEYRKMGTLGH